MFCGKQSEPYYNDFKGMAMKHLKELKEILMGDPSFMDVLKTAQGLGLAEWCIGAGVIRNIVWSRLHGFDTLTHRDIDIVYYDAAGSLRDEKLLEQRLMAMRPDLPWQVKNQALVHLWYEDKFGFSVAPLLSLEDAISTWPETATCVGAYLDDADQLQIIAPYGLEDLFAMVLRRNPKRVTEEIFEKRILDRNMSQRWPQMRILRD